MAHRATHRITWKHDLQALPFILPFLAVFLLFIGYPIFNSLMLSVHQTTIYSDFYDVFGSMRFVGADNYTMILRDPQFWWSLVLTCAYAALTILPGMALSLALAIFLNRKVRGFGALRSGFFLPNVFDIYVVGVIWLLIYNPNGGLFIVLMDWLGLDGLFQRGILSNPWLTLPAIAFAMILKGAGFGMILFMTSLNNINSSIFEAADVDGASYWQKLWYITLPLLRPIILFLSITGLVGALSSFAEIYAMTDNTGGPSLEIGGVTLQSARVSGYHLYRYFQDSMYGEAAAMSFLLLVVATIISVVNMKILSPKD
ncbi:MAG: sugar ABC transporter permease [Candidatus Sumerlaeia bacterium]|nr:sugar ABC transporter permease [Candidatus Sumerlaeia bacterium]